MKIDQKNVKILNLIQNNSKMSINEMSEKTGIPITTIFERIKKMEKENLIQGYKTLLNPEAINLSFTAFVFVRVKSPSFDESIMNKIKDIPFVLELHEVAGDYSYLAKVCAEGPLHLSEILKEHFGTIPGVVNTNSHIVLKTALTNGQYPIQGTSKTK